jgi:Putative Ig domain
MTAGLPVVASSLARRSVRASLIVLAALGATLSGCGSEDQPTAAAVEPPSSPPPPSGGTNHAPTISGVAMSSVLAGNAYLFAPTANDTDGDTLTFAITGQPAWASFDASTGRLSGTPTAADVGSYANVVISVSDGATSTALTAFSINVVATATGSATLSWTPPTQNTDGSALTNLSGYRIYWGTSQNSLVNSVTVDNPGLSSYVVDQLTPATWYFAAAALNASGMESAPSNLASKTVL